MRKLATFFAEIIRSDGRESSKRFAALFALLFLVTFVVYRYTDDSNAVKVIELLLWFIGAVFGLNVGQAAFAKYRDTKGPKDGNGHGPQ